MTLKAWVSGGMVGALVVLSYAIGAINKDSLSKGSCAAAHVMLDQKKM